MKKYNSSNNENVTSGDYAAKSNFQSMNDISGLSHQLGIRELLPPQLSIHNN